MQGHFHDINPFIIFPISAFVLGPWVDRFLTLSPKSRNAFVSFIVSVCIIGIKGLYGESYSSFKGVQNTSYEVCFVARGKCYV
jgi:hypothetical protein